MVSTRLFDRIGAVYLRLTRGSGRRFLLLLVALVAPLCAFLPNATTVILLAPIIVKVAQALEVDFVGPLVLMAIVSNSAGLLTLVGDPATFLVGSSIGMSFGGYLRTVSLGGLISVLVLVPLLPVLMPTLWRLRRPLPSTEPLPPLEKPWFAVLAVADLGLMLGLFVFGESLPAPIGPPAVAIIAASLAVLVIYSAKIEPVDDGAARHRLEDAGVPRRDLLPGAGGDEDRAASDAHRQSLPVVRQRAHVARAGSDRRHRSALEPARQHPRGGGIDLDGQGLPGGGGRGPGGGHGPLLRRLAGRRRFRCSSP